MKNSVLAGAGIAVLASTAALAQAPQQRDRGDGVQTRAELVQRVQTMFARLDANRDGFLTQGEGQAALAQHRQRVADPARRQQQADRGFERLDTNNDGQISRAEFETRQARRGMDGKARMGGGRGFGDLGARMFASADTDRDNRVSLQEATAVALQHFDRADLNRDGQVTREERRQLHQQLRAQPPARG